MRASMIGSGIAIAVAVVALLGTAASAQTLEQPRARQGYYVSLGGGAAVSAASDKDQGDKTLVGSAISIGLGQMVTPCFGLGIRIDSTSGTADSTTAGGGGLSIEGQWNPWRQLGVHAGFGFGFASLEDTEALEDATSGGYGALVTAAVTYDWFFTSRTTGGWAVTPGLTLSGLEGGDLDALTFGLGVQISWWSGRPRNELVLPEDKAY
jgi:outer membrane protein with beta-barrel domain